MAPASGAARYPACARRRVRSASTISAMVSSKPCSGSQPSCVAGARRVADHGASARPGGRAPRPRARGRRDRARRGRRRRRRGRPRCARRPRPGRSRRARRPAAPATRRARRRPRATSRARRPRSPRTSSSCSPRLMAATPRGHLARQEALGPARRLVVEGDARAGEAARGGRAAPRRARGRRAWPRRTGVRGRIGERSCCGRLAGVAEDLAGARRPRCAARLAERQRAGQQRGRRRRRSRCSVSAGSPHDAGTNVGAARW